MARNFFGETANFFLRGRDYSTLRSGKIIQNKVNFKSGSVYGCRLRLKRSLGNFGGDPQLQLDGNVSGTSDPLAGSTRRYYTFDRDAWGATYPVGAYDSLGGRFFDRTKGVFISGSSYELPQDPIHPWIAENFTGSISGKFADKGDITRESFTMYSRPSAFGPPISGRILTEMSSAVSASAYGIKDSLDGYNWSFTPPYYHGEAWMDLVFRPTKPEYTLEEILEEIETQCWRVDPGPEVAIADNINPLNEITIMGWINMSSSNSQRTFIEKCDSSDNKFFLLGCEMNTSNTIGLGDTTGLYQGTQQINQGQLDRWNVITTLNYLKFDKELEIVLAKNKSLNNKEGKELLSNMIKVADLTRKGFINGDISTVMSPRTVLHWAENTSIFKDQGYAFRITFLNKCDELEKHIIAEYYQRCFGSDLPESSVNIKI